MKINNQKKKEITLDDLALIIAGRFDEMDEKMDKGFKEMRLDINMLKDDVKEIKADTENIKAELNKKVDRFEYRSLEHQVEKLQEKFA